MNSYNLYTKCSLLTTKPESFSKILAKRGQFGLRKGSWGGLGRRVLEKAGPGGDWGEQKGVIRAGKWPDEARAKRRCGRGRKKIGTNGCILSILA
jgi:hypothetical protein